MLVVLVVGAGAYAGGTGWYLQGSDPMNLKKPCNHVWEDSGSARESVDSRTGQDAIIKQQEDTKG